MKKISVLGSCRLDGLYERCRVVDVKNAISYTHTTKEALQLIEHLNDLKENLNSSINSETVKMFRSYILDHRKIKNIKKLKSIANSFFQCSIYMVEISSRKVYTYKGKFYHDLIVEYSNKFSGVENIKQYEQSEEEISKDLDALNAVLGPNLIIVTHICYESEGSRKELKDILIKLCKEKNIKFIEPASEVSGIEKNKLYLKESKIMHYTKYGQRIIGEKYIEFLSKNFSIERSIFKECLCMIRYELKRFLVTLLNLFSKLIKV